MADQQHLRHGGPVCMLRIRQESDQYEILTNNIDAQHIVRVRAQQRLGYEVWI